MMEILYMAVMFLPLALQVGVKTLTFTVWTCNIYRMSDSDVCDDHVSKGIC